MSEPKTTGCDHNWFTPGRHLRPWDKQCGVCGVWLTDECDRLAHECDRLGLPEAAAALREMRDGKRSETDR